MDARTQTSQLRCLFLDKFVIYLKKKRNNYLVSVFFFWRKNIRFNYQDLVYFIFSGH